MPILGREQVYPFFLQHARNSSHFVWLLSDLRYFQASNGWIFAFAQRGSVTLLALEPLIPGEPEKFSKFQEKNEAFRAAWKEFEAEARPKVAAFVSVYAPFLKLLEPMGFQWVKVGHEPWVQMENCIPRGNAGKGVRSARNQALRLGLRVEEWKSGDIQADPHKKATLSRLIHEWKSTRLVQLTGFMNATDPFAFMECRRYFVVQDASGNVSGYQVATPVSGIQSYFLEDLVLGANAPRGAGELLTLETLVALQESGVKLSSLGVVSVTGADGNASHALPDLVKFFMVTFPRIAAKFYNFDGLEVFRSRFVPGVWEDIHIAVQNNPGSGVSDSVAWFKVLFALLLAFRPRFHFSSRWFLRTLLQPVRKFPVTWIVGLASVLPFMLINRLGDLPESTLEHYSFTAAAPLYEWFYRTVTSDFLYFDRSHFISCLIPLLVVLRWAESTHRRSFVVLFFASMVLLDDFINYLFIFYPFNYFHPELFRNLVGVKDVGGSLLMATLFGLQLCQVRKHREILFVAACVVAVFGFAFSSTHLKALILNLNHFLFLSIGFVIGKFQFEMVRRRSREMSRKKPPDAKCVLPQKKAA